MNDNVRKVFDMLGVEPNEKFKIEGNGDTIYYIDEKLYVYRNNEILGSDCNKCIFNNVYCSTERNWINHKDIFSDKFLNQEIEVEE